MVPKKKLCYSLVLKLILAVECILSKINFHINTFYISFEFLFKSNDRICWQYCWMLYIFYIKYYQYVCIFSGTIHTKTVECRIYIFSMFLFFLFILPLLLRCIYYKYHTIVKDSSFILHFIGMVCFKCMCNFFPGPSHFLNANAMHEFRWKIRSLNVNMGSAMAMLICQCVCSMFTLPCKWFRLWYIFAYRCWNCNARKNLYMYCARMHNI